MKVRLEIINDDGTKKASAEFEYADRHSLLAFLDIYADETRTTTEPSSTSSNSQVNAVEQNTCQSQYVQQQAPLNYQQPVQQTQVQQAPVQQAPVQQVLPQQYPQQYSQLPVQAPAQPQAQQFGQVNMQNPGPVRNPDTIPDHNLSPQYIQPNLPPVGGQQYGYGQPAQPMSSTFCHTMNPNQPTPPAVPPIVAPVQSFPQQVQIQRKVPSLHTRMNDTSLTISERLEFFLKYEYPRIWFSSQDIQKQYERIYGEIKQSTVSTYLSRMFRKNLLARRGNRTQREYRYIADEVESGSDVQMGQVPEMPQDYRFQY